MKFTNRSSRQFRIYMRGLTNQKNWGGGAISFGIRHIHHQLHSKGLLPSPTFFGMLHK